jgi:hypothetical protein
MTEPTPETQPEEQKATPALAPVELHMNEDEDELQIHHDGEHIGTMNDNEGFSVHEVRGIFETLLGKLGFHVHHKTIESEEQDKSF